MKWYDTYFIEAGEAENKFVTLKKIIAIPLFILCLHFIRIHLHTSNVQVKYSLARIPLENTSSLSNVFRCHSFQR